jgi:hypothetical protein
MARPTITELRKIARQRSSILRNSEKGLLARANSMERKLNAYLLGTFFPSKVKNTTFNLKKINKATGLKKFIKNVVNVAMFGYYDKQFNSIEGATRVYFSPFEPRAAAERRIINRGQIIVDGFVDSIFDNNDIVRGLQQTIKNGITSEQSTTELKQMLTDQVKGKQDKLGIISSYHSKNGRDQFQAYSRSLDEEFSKTLNLNYAIYAGGEILTTRKFCDDRNGLVFNRETILEWNTTPATWQGRKPNNNILIDLGGYNCRHDLDWISYALARRLNPNIEKSKFDKKQKK